MKILLLSLTYAVGVGELILAGYFWVTNSKNEIRKVVALLGFATAMWGTSNAVTGVILNEWDVYANIFGPLLLTALIHLAIIFPHRLFTFDRFHAAALYGLWALFSYLVLGTDTIVVDMYVRNNAAYTTSGPLFTLFNIYLGALYFCGLGLLVWKTRRLDGAARRNTKILFWSLLIAGLPGVFFAIFHFMKDVPFNYLYGPISSVVWLGATMYIVRKS